MLAIVLITLASSIEFPIHFTETTGLNEIPALALINQDNITPVYFSNLIEFYIKPKIGGQTVNLFLDLNSDESVVALYECYCTNYKAPIYNPNDSQTSKDVSPSTDPSKSHLIRYKYYKDNFALGSLTAYDQYFYAAIWHSTYHEPLSGTLGLGDKKKNKDKQSFIRNLYEQNAIKSPVFSLALMNPSHPEHSSVLTIGEYDFSKYSIGLQNVIKTDAVEGAWSTSVTSMKLDSVTYSSRREIAFLIPAMSYIILPRDEYKLFMDQIKSKFECGNSGFNYCFCSSSSDVYLFPELTFTIEGNSYTISPENYVTYLSEGKCKIAIVDFGITTYFLGAPFFYEYYSVFDMSNHQITLAKASYSSSKKSSGTSGYITYSAFGLIGVAAFGLMAWKATKDRESIESYKPL